ncbi:tetratricopeptide repeat protein [Gimesia fumaroli]|uniref:Tetratricopeptide repeat protein n=1 Tax=Gimesia fumaroli TaxID=2527976 RepID=A0A518I7J4_9PLAN|nr:tetratricopeptide repeat protein [Gimesia fumaroli]QDV49063.1 Tetratricopeptide repeat protein [Gimesia fumaroli]
MKTRMFQHTIFLTFCCITLCGCQSAPFSRRFQKNESLSQKSTESEEESAIQKNLREAMAAERAKGRLERQQRNGPSEYPESLAGVSNQDEMLRRLAAKVESQALPLNSTQNPIQQPQVAADESKVLRELNLAYDADRAGNFEKAQGYYQRVLSMDPDNFEALHRLAIIEDKKQNFPAAEAYYLGALKLDPSNSDLLSDIGYSYMLQGRDDYGERYLQEALKYQPGHVRSLDHLGWFYGRTGQYDQALALFRMTGNEAEAQLKFAQLFPGVDPNQRSAQASMTPSQIQHQSQKQNPIQQNPVQMGAPDHSVPRIQPVGQVQSDYQQPVQYAAAGNPQAPTAPVMSQAGNNPTLQIAEMMKREREKAIQARSATAAPQLPAINPNQAMVQQYTGSQMPVDNQQNAQPYQSAPAEPNPTAAFPATTAPAAASTQIQAWPPVGDPGIAQAAQASNYWALKEQQLQNQYQQQQQQIQNQNPRQLRQAPQRQLQNQSYQNPIAQGLQRQQPGQNQNLPRGGQQMKVQQVPQQRMPANVPRAGQPLYGNQYHVPGQFPGYQINATQSPAQQKQPASGTIQQQSDQELIREAVRTGMNLGPGQMFPVAEGSPHTPNGSPSLSAQMNAGTIIPASAQVPAQNVFRPGGQNIQQAQVGQPIYQQQSSGGIRQAGYEYSNQANPQGAVKNASLQYQSMQQAPATLPPSVMYSSNPAVAPANVRTMNTDQDQGLQQNNYGTGMNPSQNQRQALINQRANPQSSSPFQWGADPSDSQQPATQYRFPTQQGQY